MVNYYSGEHYLVKISGVERHQICIHYVYKSITSISGAKEGIPYACHHLIQ